MGINALNVVTFTWITWTGRHKDYYCVRLLSSVCVYVYSVCVYTHTIVFPTCLKAFSTNSLTLCTSPVAMTKSSGSSFCSISHIAWKTHTNTHTQRLNNWEIIKTVWRFTLDAAQLTPDRQEVNLWPLRGAFARTSVLTSPPGLMGYIVWERRTERSHRPNELLAHVAMNAHEHVHARRFAAR